MRNLFGQARADRVTGRKRFYRNVLSLLMGVLAVASMALAQLPTATILGVVKDTGGAVVPDAMMVARNVDTGETRSAVSGADGSYRFSALQIGRYEVKADHAGFQTEVRSGLTMTVSQEAVVNFSLQVGAVEQTVTVSAEAPLVNTTSGSLGGLVNEERMTDLPLNGRNYLDLIYLQSGVHKMANTSQTGAKGGAYISSNGAPVRSNNYMLDGAPLVTAQGTSSASTTGESLGVEGIQEYRVVTNSFSAEYGLSMGSQTIMVSKGGTNTFHGDAFEYLRNSVMDARNFFDYPSAATKPGFRLPEFQRNQFGGAGGGPIKKDKTFFFATYEGLRARVGQTTIDNVPAPGCHGPAGAIITNTACSQLTTTSSVTIAPAIAPFLALMPLPNLPNNQFTPPFIQPIRDDYGQIRVDQNFSASDKMFGRYTIQDSALLLPLAFPQFTYQSTGRNQYTTAAEDHIFTPSLLNSARYSYSRTVVFSNSFSNITGPQYSLVPGLDMGSLSPGSGLTAFGPNTSTPSDKIQNVFTWSDDLFLAHGKHAFKMGALINRFQQWILLGNVLKGSVSFPSLAGFLAGTTSTYSALTPGSDYDRTWHETTYGFYFQDDFRATSKLTLNLGLRYEFDTQLHEIHNINSVLVNTRQDAQVTITPIPFLNPTLKNFSPRFGFAWDMMGNGKMALRGGFAEMYDLPTNMGSVLNSMNSGTPPFSSQITVGTPATFTAPLNLPVSAATTALRMFDYHLASSHILSYNLTLDRQLPLGIDLTLAYAGSRGLDLMQNVEGNPKIPTILSNGEQFWTASTPRANPNFSTIQWYPAAGDSWYNSLQFGLNKRLGHGLQFQSAYTWSKLLDDTQGQAAGDSTGSSVFGSSTLNTRLDKGRADFDLEQVWWFNAIYNLPQTSAHGLVGGALNGWWVSGIFSLQSGAPFTVALNTNRSLSGVNSGGAGIDRPDGVPGVNVSDITSGASTGCGVVGSATYLPAGTPVGTVARWFDPCAFSIPVQGFLGNEGRNTATGPGLSNLDFSLVKDTKIKYLGESGKLQFRAEVFNLFNHANFAIPNRTVYTASANVESPLATAGQITSTVNSSRQIQLALKLLF